MIFGVIASCQGTASVTEETFAFLFKNHSASSVSPHIRMPSRCFTCPRPVKFVLSWLHNWHNALDGMMPFGMVMCQCVRYTIAFI